MDRWRYARDEHPAYCTCVDCVENRDERRDGSHARRRSQTTSENPVERFFSWLRSRFSRR